MTQRRVKNLVSMDFRVYSKNTEHSRVPDDAKYIIIFSISS